MASEVQPVAKSELLALIYPWIGATEQDFTVCAVHREKVPCGKCAEGRVRRDREAQAIYAEFGASIAAPRDMVTCELCGYTRWVDRHAKLEKRKGRVMIAYTPGKDRGCQNQKCKSRMEL